MRQTGMHVLLWTFRPGAGAWVLEDNPGVRTAIGCKETARGNRREEVWNRECLCTKIELPWKEGATTKLHTGDGVTNVASLFPHGSACCQATEKTWTELPLTCLQKGAREGLARASLCALAGGS